MKLITGIIVGLLIGIMLFATQQEKRTLLENAVDSVMTEPLLKEENEVAASNTSAAAANSVIEASQEASDMTGNTETNTGELAQAGSEQSLSSTKASDLPTNKQVFWKPFLSQDKAQRFCQKVIELGVTCNVGVQSDNTYQVYFLYQDTQDREQKVSQIEQGLAMTLELEP